MPVDTLPHAASDYPAPKDGIFVARDFHFHSGETLPELRLGYKTIGNAAGEPVLVLHGTGGSSASKGRLGIAASSTASAMVLISPPRRSGTKSRG